MPDAAVSTNPFAGTLRVEQSDSLEVILQLQLLQEREAFKIIRKALSSNGFDLGLDWGLDFGDFRK